MKLDEAITWLERKAKNEEWLAQISISERPKLFNQIDAAKDRQLAEWLRELKRADTLLKATYDLLKKQDGNYYVLNLLAETVYYDDAECDGNCLMEDIDAWMYGRGIDYDTTRDCHIADSGKKVSISCGHENDLVFREAAIEALARMMPRSYTPDGSHPADEEIFRAQEVIADCIEALEILTPAQPDNQTNLCDSCDCSYPDCPSKYDDVIFGNGIGNDNICACNKYKPSAQPEQKKDEWIPISKETNPTKSGWYLVTVHEDATNDNERFTGMAEFNAINGMWYDIDEPTDMYLRWMPLPAPYRGGEMT